MTSITREVEVTIDLEDFDDDDIIAYASELMSNGLPDELHKDDLSFIAEHLQNTSDALRAAGDLTEAYRLDYIIGVLKQ